VNLKVALTRVLETLEQHHGILSGTIMLPDEPTGNLVIKAATDVS
jgi:hypothetical protein